jgi:hypothetical protein
VAEPGESQVFWIDGTYDGTIIVDLVTKRLNQAWATTLSSR